MHACKKSDLQCIVLSNLMTVFIDVGLGGWGGGGSCVIEIADAEFLSLITENQFGIYLNELFDIQFINQCIYNKSKI